MYHALWQGGADATGVAAQWESDPQLRDPGARRYALDDRMFRLHMSAIVRAGGVVPQRWDDMNAPDPSARVVITFDDGHRSNHELALPILREHSLSAMFFITTDWIGAPGFMTIEELRAMRQEGMLLGTHGCTHRYFADLDSAELRREMRDSKEKLESILSEHVPAVALPGGRLHPETRRIAQELGYRHVFTSQIGLAKADGDPLAWPRVPVQTSHDQAWLTRLLNGDSGEIERMARSARWRDLAKRLLGNTLYDRLRGRLLARG